MGSLELTRTTKPLGGLTWVVLRGGGYAGCDGVGRACQWGRSLLEIDYCKTLQNKLKLRKLIGCVAAVMVMVVKGRRRAGVGRVWGQNE